MTRRRARYVYCHSRDVLMRKNYVTKSTKLAYSTFFIYRTDILKLGTLKPVTIPPQSTSYKKILVDFRPVNTELTRLIYAQRRRSVPG